MQYLHSINAIRGIIAISVCLYHASAAFGDFGAFPKGYLGVDLFFLLSGFIAQYRFENRPNFNLKTQIIRRFFRIYPNYIFATILGAILMLGIYFYRGYPLNLGGEISPYIFEFFKSFGLNLLLIPDFSTKQLIIQGPIFPCSLQNWTLFWELIISIFFLISIRFGAFFKTTLTIIFIALFFLVFSSHENLNHGFDAKGFWLGGLRAFCGLFLGILCADFFNKLNQKSRKIFAKFAPIFVLDCLLFYSWRGGLSVWFDIIICLFLNPIMLIGVASSNSIIFTNKIMRFLGRISFSIFSLHIVILSFMFFIYSNFGLFHLNILSGLIYLSIVIIFAAIFEKFVERPIQSAFKKH